MRYMCLLYGEPNSGPPPGTAEFGEMLEEFQSSTQAMADAGVLVDSSPGSVQGVPRSHLSADDRRCIRSAARFEAM